MNSLFIVGHPFLVRNYYKDAAWNLIIWLPTVTNEKCDEKVKTISQIII